MQLQLTQLKFRFTALQALHFPAYLAGSILRGALGTHFPPLLYREFLRKPKPWVLRVAHLNHPGTIQPGETFRFGVNLFDNRPEVATAVLEAFHAVEMAGFGSPRALVRLAQVERQDDLVVNLSPGERRLDQLTIEFATPTALESGGKIMREAPFAVLVARAHQRISLLKRQYGDGGSLTPLPTSTPVSVSESQVSWIDCFRKSRSGSGAQSLSGILGRVTYKGRVSPFLSLLEAAQWSGVGRATSFGNGEIRVIPAQEIR